MGKGNSPSVSKPLISNAPSRCATFRSYVPSSRKAIFSRSLTCRVKFAYSRLFVIYYARGPNSRSAPSLNSPRESDKDFVLGAKVNLCCLFCPVALYRGLTYVRRNITSTCSSVRLLPTIMLPNVWCSASLRASD